MLQDGSRAAPATLQARRITTIPTKQRKPTRKRLHLRCFVSSPEKWAAPRVLTARRAGDAAPAGRSPRSRYTAAGGAVPPSALAPPGSAASPSLAQHCGARTFPAPLIRPPPGMAADGKDIREQPARGFT